MSLGFFPFVFSFRMDSGINSVNNNKNFGVNYEVDVGYMGSTNNAKSGSINVNNNKNFGVNSSDGAHLDLRTCMNDLNHGDSMAQNSETHGVGKNDEKHGDSDVNMPNMSTQSVMNSGPSQNNMNGDNARTQTCSTLVLFADMFKDKAPKKTVKISEIRNENCVVGANVTIAMETVN